MWKDFKWVEKRFGTKFANILKRFDKGSKEIEEHFTTKENHEVTFTDANGVQNTLVTEQGISEVLAKNGLIEVKWQELKDKRDADKLTPGALYRIIDYNCTTTQEDTRSAGHQFDIVLLALSENKLAEEGWAMMHDNIYDVTFDDGVTKKCWINFLNDSVGTLYLVDITTSLGLVTDTNSVTIDEANKTATTIDDAVDLAENLPYNYFQNSNLSAWKVWYCLDNDKSRFAWADDSVDEDVPESFIADGVNYYRYSLQDVGLDKKAPYCYKGLTEGSYIYVPTIVTSETEEISINSYYNPSVLSAPTQITSFTPAHEGTGLPNGHGVIYRLIDEWNNDVCYDFKNIQFIRPMTDGEYKSDGEDTWCYTFSYYDSNSNDIIDSSLGIRFDGLGDDYIMEYSKLNFIKTESLDSNVFIDVSSDNEIINSGNNTFTHLLNSKIVGTHSINGLRGVSVDYGKGSLILMSCFDDLNGNPFPTKPNIIIENRALIQE